MAFALQANLLIYKEFCGLFVWLTVFMPRRIKGLGGISPYCSQSYPQVL
jgi:hypothetical protein